MSPSATRRFISRKISKIRWRPERHSRLGIPADTFVCGSYGDEHNLLTLWKLPNDTIEFKDATQITALPVSGDVTDLKFIHGDLLVSASSCGSVTLYEITASEKAKFVQKFTWEKLHYLRESGCSSSCTAVDVLDDGLISVGEDGKLNILSLINLESTPIRVIEADSSPICSAVFLKHNECLTGGMRGQLKLWDLRLSGDAPAAVMFLKKLTKEHGPRGFPLTLHPSVSCLAVHPTQCHILANGANCGGDISVWDLRSTSSPISVLQTESTAVRELKFHPDAPDHMFWCTQDGQLRHLDCSAPKEIMLDPSFGSLRFGDQNNWLNLGKRTYQPRVTSLMPNTRMAINTLDISVDTVLCGADDEAVYACFKVQCRA